jgi:signal transduction histidine kinase
LKEIFIVLNALTAVLGRMLIFVGLVSYFVELHTKLNFALFLTPILFSFIGFAFNGSSGAIALSVYSLFAFYLSLIIILFAKRVKIRELFGKSTKFIFITQVFIISFIPIAILSFLNNESYGFYNSTNNFLVMLNYFSGIGFTLSIIVIFIHLEYSINLRQKNQLKDNYSHDLGNIIQIINGAIFILESQSNLNEKNKANLEIVQKNSNKASELIKMIRNL